MPFKTLPDSEGRTFERANRNVLKRHLDENTWISWDSTVYGIIKKTLELVVLVDAIDGFGQGTLKIEGVELGNRVEIFRCLRRSCINL
ncbi:hypothetical protein Y032_0885g2853 [Ancylostoma ceylanicum]|uniref:Uncharacterized protein n=1 Tax=Ancylostoma ceylanicum TaxID=53326 RepID=A0A016WC43_9BILA|nr:hypothetical protein Y032_0885g2853 [Ancylostoma ceylanicum]